MLLINKIIDLKEDPTLSKHEQLVHGIVASIDEGIISVGDQLPSINVMVEKTGYARKTIVKAYDELKDRGLVESKKVKGYFIISQETKVTLKIALLLFAFQRFQEEFYNTFRKELGKRYQIDVFFHHNNSSIFETILFNIKGKYGKYVIAPIANPEITKHLEAFAPEKLLIIDRFLPMPHNFSYIAQEFENSNYNKLVELLPDIRKYKKFILFFDSMADSTPEVLRAFNRFILDYGINGGVEKKYKKGLIKQNNLYFCVSDTYLWDVIRDSRENGFEVGSDIGILSHDDHVVKELISGGITTISTNFKEMAKIAANQIKYGAEIKMIMPMNLIRRNSL
jgi:DNA-binding transcriptional regulator YhcF (GntR family)